MTWGSPVELIRKDRIKLSLAALQYELRPLDDPYMDDHQFDALAIKVAKTRHISTGHDVMDEFFFCGDFNPCTGQWVRRHPERDKLDRLHHRLKMSKYGDAFA